MKCIDPELIPKIYAFIILCEKLKWITCQELSNLVLYLIKAIVWFCFYFRNPFVISLFEVVHYFVSTIFKIFFLAGEFQIVVNHIFNQRCEIVFGFPAENGFRFCWIT